MLLIHQIPPEPAYLRAKVGRRLARIGAIAVKNAAYVLPAGDAALERFQWLRTEIVAGGGTATILAARFVDGLSDDDVTAMFRAARDADYTELVTEIRSLGRRKPRADDRAAWTGVLERLEARRDEIAAIDFFAAPQGDVAIRLLRELRARIAPPERRSLDMLSLDQVRDRVWVTRAGVKIDRIASAWLVRRFVNDRAELKFVTGHDYVPQAGEVRFDMMHGELTHEGDRCTFEVMVARLGLAAPGLRAIAEIIHDIDLDDDRYARAETAGVAALVAGLVATCPDDLARIERGGALFDALLAHFAAQRGGA